VVRGKNSPLFEIALVLVRFNHVASVIVNANHSADAEGGSDTLRRKVRRVRAMKTRSVLNIVRELVSRLIQLDVIRAGHDHHDDAAVLALLYRTSELRSFRPQLADSRIDVVAHQRDRVVTRVVVSLAFPFAVRRVHAHLARPRFENEPIVIEILGDVLPP
jgi:hypothetical protein